MVFLIDVSDGYIMVCQDRGRGHRLGDTSADIISFFFKGF